MPHNHTKAHSEMDRDELINEVDKKQALPDMVLKRMYFNAQEKMTEAEKMLMYHFYANNGTYNDLDIFRLRIAILGCFRPISGMIAENKIYNWLEHEEPLILKKNGVKSDYDLCLKLITYGKVDVPSLIHLVGYVNFCLHELGLTNLLLNIEGGELDISKIV